MGLQPGGGQPGAIHVGVDLGSIDVGMAQEFLYHTQIRSALQQMGGKTVSQRVGREPARKTGFSGDAFDQIPHRYPRKAPATLVEKHGRCDLFTCQARSSTRQIPLQSLQRGLSYRNSALFTALAPQKKCGLARVQIRNIHPAQLADPTSAAVQCFQNGPIAKFTGFLPINVLDQSDHLYLGKNDRQFTTQLGSGDRRGGILLQRALVDQETVEGAQAGKQSGPTAGDQIGRRGHEELSQMAIFDGRGFKKSLPGRPVYQPEQISVQGFQAGPRQTFFGRAVGQKCLEIPFPLSGKGIRIT